MTRKPTLAASALAAILGMSLLTACGENGATETYNGYVEGIYVSVAPREGGRIAEMNVARGDRVAAGDTAFRMEDDDAAAAAAAARAELARAKAQLADLSSGRRPEEIAVTRAQLEEAEAKLVEAERQFERQKELFGRRIVSQATLDQARAGFDAAAARVESLKRQINVENMAAREQALEAARNLVAAQMAQLEQAEWRLDQRTVAFPAAGTVEEIVRRAGELAGPDAPAVTLLPDGNRIVRFFVPEAARAHLKTGQEVVLSCDGCPEGFKATVTYVAAQAEYTPPVIYSVESRQKLVFLVEARPSGEAASLSPGQLVDVAVAGGPAQ